MEIIIKTDEIQAALLVRGLLSSDGISALQAHKLAAPYIDGIQSAKKAAEKKDEEDTSDDNDAPDSA
jgi:hypothetical protein